MIWSSIATSARLAALEDFEERLLWRVLVTSDSWGRERGDAFSVRIRCVPGLPVSDDDVEAALVALEEAEQVFRWEQDGVTYVQVVGFDEHQLGELRRKRGASKFPDPPANAGTSPALGPDHAGPTPGPGRDHGGSDADGLNKPETASADDDAGTTPGVGPDHAGRGPSESRVEESREEENKLGAREAELAAHIVAVLQAVPKAGYVPDKLTDARVLALVEQFPDRDHLAEAHALADWETHGAGAKLQTKDGISRFRNWLRRAAPATVAAAAAPQQQPAGVVADVDYPALAAAGDESW